MSLESFNMQTLIHVGVELVVVGGLAFWANRRIVGVENSVADLAKKIVALEGVIEKQQQFMMQQDTLMRQLLGMSEPQRASDPRNTSRQPQTNSQPQQYQNAPSGVSYPPQQTFEPRPNIPQLNPRTSPLQSQPLPRVSQPLPRVAQPLPEVEEDPDISPDVLDDIISRELGNMASETSEMEIQMTPGLNETKKTPIKKKKTQIVAARKKKIKKGLINAEL